MKKNYEQMADQIIQCSGGGGNFLTVTNCATRVRVTYRDMELINPDKLKEIDGVLSVIVKDGVQIVVGPGVCKIIAELIQKKLNITEDPAYAAAEKTEVKKKGNILRIFSDIFVPILPAMIAGGVLQGLNNCLINFAALKAAEAGIQATEQLSAAQVWLQNCHLLGLSGIISVIYSAAFSFLAVYVGYNAAKQFKVEPVLGALLGCVTLQGGLGLLGVSSGQGGLIGVILGVFVMASVQKLVKKVVPNAVDVVVTPVLTMLITAALMVRIFMPICGILSDGIVDGLMWLLNTTGIFGGFVLSALAPLLISTGLHHGLTAIHMEMINSVGTAPLLACQVMSNAGMVVRLFDVAFSAMGMAGMSAVPLVADGKYLFYIISYFGGAAAAFVLTLAVGKMKHYE